MKKFIIFILLVICFSGKCFAYNDTNNSINIDTNRFSSSISMKYKNNYFDCLVNINRKKMNFSNLFSF